MAIFGLGDSATKDVTTKTKKKSKKNSKASLQEDEAKALLEKMEAKKDAGECPFC